MKSNKFYSRIAAGLEAMNIEYQEYMIDQLQDYLKFLKEENKKYNLTALDEPDEIITKHFFDSLSFLSKFNLKQEKFIDIGTGAGFPGMVIKIFKPGLDMILLDSLAKRVNFLKKLSTRLGLKKLEVVHARAEDLARDKIYREGFDWVVARAVAPVNTLSEYTLPLVRLNGKAVFF